MSSTEVSDIPMFPEKAQIWIVTQNLKCWHHTENLNLCNTNATDPKAWSSLGNFWDVHSGSQNCAKVLLPHAPDEGASAELEVTHTAASSTEEHLNNSGSLSGEEWPRSRVALMMGAFFPRREGSWSSWRNAVPQRGYLGYTGWPQGHRLKGTFLLDFTNCFYKL